MRIDLSSTQLLRDLIAELSMARCLVRQLDGKSCRVTVLDTDDPDEALVELTFFVRAWVAVHPGVAATVTG